MTDFLQALVRQLRRSLMLAMLALCLPPAPVMAQSGSTAEPPAASGGPIRLRQPQPATGPQRSNRGDSGTVTGTGNERDRERDRERDEPIYKPGEFERYIQRLLDDMQFRRFGAELVVERGSEADVQEFNPAVPADYLIGVGDELIVTLWGAVEADLRLTVDRTGRIHVPRVGSVLVAGSRYSEVTPLIERQVARVFRNFQLSISLGQLRGVRVFVTGFATRPGAYTASSLSTLSSVLFNRAGGPAAAGSFRSVELRRGGQTVATLDLYELMLHGKREADRVLQAEDVIHVNPVGKEVALIGSVNKPAIFELKPGETVADLLRMGGGLSSIADRSRVAVERLGERNDLRVRQLELPAQAALVLDAGDVVRAFSAVAAALPLERQNRRVLIEGEFQRPGIYVLPPQSTIADALKAAGGLTGQAFIFGTEFSRESVRIAQQSNYERALRDLEIEVAKRSTAVATRTAEETLAASAQASANERLLQRLRAARPTGRIVLQLAPDAKDLPELALEDGDRLYVPGRPTTVGVFGSVFNAGSYLFRDQRAVDDYLRLAGSPTRGADPQSIFVVRANGSVISAQQQQASWLGLGRSNSTLTAQAVLPGDTIFVPEEINKTTFVQGAKDWTQILYQLGIGLASIWTITR